MSYTRTNWVTGETPLSAGNMNNIEDGIEELNSNKISGVTNNVNETIPITNGVVTATRSGWLSVSATCDSGVSLAPFLEVRAENGLPLGSAWGITASGSSLRVSVPAKKGQKYSVYGVRCTIGASARLHY